MSSYILAYILPHIYTAMNNMADHQIIDFVRIAKYHCHLALGANYLLSGKQSGRRHLGCSGSA